MCFRIKKIGFINQTQKGFVGFFPKFLIGRVKIDSFH